MYSQEKRTVAPPKPADDDREVGLDEWDDEVADHYKVPRTLMKAIRTQESGGNPNAVSPTGVRGRYQITERTAKQYGLDRNDPFQQSVAAAKHLRTLYDQTKGADDDERWLGASAKYYGGDNAVQGDEVSTNSLDGLSNPSRYAENIAKKWGELRKAERANQQPVPSTVAVGHSQQYKPLARPQSPPTRNVFNKNLERDQREATAEARKALDFRPAGGMQVKIEEDAKRINRQISPEVQRQVAQRDARLQQYRADAERRGSFGQRARDLYQAGANIGQGAQQGFENLLTFSGLRDVANLSPAVKAQMAQGRLAQEATNQRMAEEQQANNSMASQLTRGTGQAVGGTAILAPVAMVGGVPGVMAATGLQQDWEKDPKGALLNTATAGLPIVAGRAISPVAGQIASRVRPGLQRATQVGIEAGAGGLANVGQYAGTQAALGREINPEEALVQGITGAGLSGVMSPPLRQVQAQNALNRIQQEAKRWQPAAEPTQAAAPPTPNAPPKREWFPAGVEGDQMFAKASEGAPPASSDAASAVPPVNATPPVAALPKREDFAPGAVGDRRFRKAMERAQAEQAKAAKPAKEPKPQMAAADLRSQVDALKTEAVEAENAGNYEVARTKYRSAQQMLGELIKGARKRGDAPELSRLVEESNAANRNYQIAGNKAARAAKQGIRVSEPKNAPATRIITPVESTDKKSSFTVNENRPVLADDNAPTRDLTAPLPASEVKTPQSVEGITRTTAEIPRVRPQVSPIPEASAPLPPFPKLTPPTNRITEGAGNELPRRVSQPLEGQPIEAPERPAPAAPSAAERLARLRAAAQQAPPMELAQPERPAPMDAFAPESRLDRLKRIAQQVNEQYAPPPEAPAQTEAVPVVEAKPVQKQRPAPPTGEPKLSNRTIKQSLQEEMGATSTNRSDKLRLSGPSENYREVVTRWDDAPEGTRFTKPEHYGDEANVLFDRRLEDRKTTQGENATFFMEAQSDWHQSKDAPPAPMKNTWLRRALDDTVSEAAQAGQDGVLLPKTVEQLYEIQRWGAVKQKDGRYINSEGFDITPVVRRYLRELPDLAKKAANKAGVKLETRTVDDGKGGQQELWYLPVKKAEKAAEVDFAQLAGQSAAERIAQAEKPQRRKATDTLSPIEYLKRKTNREGFRVSDKGEARRLGSKEAGIVGLTNRRSKWSTHDAQVMLDEAGFTMPDGRAFTDSSVTESDFLSYLENYGKQGKQNTAGLDQRLADEEAEHYRRMEEQEVAAGTQEPSNIERRRLLRERAPIGEFGKLSEYSRRRATEGKSLSGSDELRKLLDLPPMPEYRDAEEGKTSAWGKAAQETMDALAEAAGNGKERSSQMGLEGLRDAWTAVQKRAKERGTPISDDLRKRFVDTATDYKVGFLEPYMRLHEVNPTVDTALAEIDDIYESGKTLTAEQNRRLYRTLRDEFVREGITEHYFRKTYWPAVKQAGSENRGNPARTGETRSRSDVPARATGTEGGGRAAVPTERKINETQSQAPDVARDPGANRAAGENAATARQLKEIAALEWSGDISAAEAKQRRDALKKPSRFSFGELPNEPKGQVLGAGLGGLQKALDKARDAQSFGELPKTRADVENSPQFKEWSTADGRQPLVNKKTGDKVFYHGTSRNFSAFSPKKSVSGANVRNAVGGQSILDALRNGKRPTKPKTIPPDFDVEKWMEKAESNALKNALSPADRAKVEDNATPEAERNRLLNSARLSPQLDAALAKAFDEMDVALAAKNYNDFMDAALRAKVITDAPATNWEKAGAIRKAAMLSRPVSHLRNLLGNTAFQNLEEGARVPGSMADALLSVATNRRSLQGASVTDSAHAIYAAATDGWQAAKDAMAGRSSEDLAKALQVKEIHFNNRYVDKAVKTVFRSLGAEDQIFFTGAYDRAIREAAKLQARNEARQGIIARKDVEARQKALLAAPTAQMETDATLAAEVAVFRNDNKLSSAIGAAREHVGDKGNFALDLVLPFDRTPTNVVLRALEYSPIGAVRGGIKAVAGTTRALNARRKAPTKADVQAAIDKAFTPAQQRSAAQLLGRGTVGTGLLALGYALASKGLMTGFYDDDDYKGEALKRAAGAQPLAIQLGGRWWGLNGVGPIGMALGMGATMYDESKKKGGDIYGGAAKAAKEQIMELPSLSSAKDLAKDAERVGKDRANAGKLVGNLAASFIPGIVGDVTQSIPYLRDPMEREVKDDPKKVKGLRRALREGGGQIGAKIPGVRRMLPVKKDIMGKPVEARPLQAIDPFNSRPARPIKSARRPIGAPTPAGITRTTN